MNHKIPFSPRAKSEKSISSFYPLPPTLISNTLSRLFPPRLSLLRAEFGDFPLQNIMMST